VQDPYSTSVRIDSLAGNIGGAINDFLSFVNEYTVRKQIETALKQAQPQIRALMPTGPRQPGTPVRDGVLVVARVEQWAMANELGNKAMSFKNIVIFGHYRTELLAKALYERMPKLESYTPGWENVAYYIWVTP
jgi:hypothetical protein